MPSNKALWALVVISNVNSSCLRLKPKLEIRAVARADKGSHYLHGQTKCDRTKIRRPLESKAGGVKLNLARTDAKGEEPWGEEKGKRRRETCHEYDCIKKKYKNKVQRAK